LYFNTQINKSKYTHGTEAKTVEMRNRTTPRSHTFW